MNLHNAIFKGMIGKDCVLSLTDVAFSVGDLRQQNIHPVPSRFGTGTGRLSTNRKQPNDVSTVVTDL